MERLFAEKSGTSGIIYLYSCQDSANAAKVEADDELGTGDGTRASLDGQRVGATDFMSIEKILEAESESSVGGICIFCFESIILFLLVEKSIDELK